MSIQFTQFLRPDGRKRSTVIDRPKEIEDLAKKLIDAGYVFEIEELMTGAISMEIVNPRTEESLAAEICANGPSVLAAIDKMIKDASKSLDTLSKSDSFPA